MSSARVLPGLSAATQLASRGAAVTLIEARRAGGRALPLLFRSGDGRRDRQWQSSGPVRQSRGARLSGAHRRARMRWPGPPRAEFDFVDLRDGERWTLRPNDGPLPWWMPARPAACRAPSARDYLAICAAAVGRPASTHRRCRACKGALWERLMRPFLLAALNTEPEESSARWPARCCARPWPRAAAIIARASPTPTLAAAFVDPALAYLERQGRAGAAGHAAARPDAWAIAMRLALEFADATVPLDATTIWWCWRCRPGWPRTWCPT